MRLEARRIARDSDGAPLRYAPRLMRVVRRNNDREL